jgi:hypothetical protein
MQKIPPNFCKHIPWEASRKAKNLKEASMAATLEGPSGRTWQVVIRRTAEGTFFASGWAQFVQDQALRELEFLVFRHDGGTRFAAMVFDKSACQREDLLLAGEARPSRKRGRPKKAERARNDSVGRELVTYRAPGEQQLQVACSNPMPLLGQSSEESAGEHGQVKAEAGGGDEVPPRSIAAPSPPRHGPAAAGARTENGCVAKTRSIQDVDLAVAACSIPPSVRRYNGYVSRRRPVSRAERQRAMELGHAFRSSLPYCVIRMSTMHVYYSFMMVSGRQTYRFPVGLWWCL